MQFLYSLGFLALLTPIYALPGVTFGVNLYSDDNCQNQIASVSCESVFYQCTTLGQGWNSYQMVTTSLNCLALSGENQDFEMYPAGCNSQDILGGGCNADLGCQKNNDGVTAQSINCILTSTGGKRLLID